MKKRKLQDCTSISVKADDDVNPFLQCRKVSVSKEGSSTTDLVKFSSVSASLPLTKAKEQSRYRDKLKSICESCFNAIVFPCIHFKSSRLKLVIIGHNPSEHAYSTGHFYSNPTNWLVMRRVYRCLQHRHLSLCDIPSHSYDSSLTLLRIMRKHFLSACGSSSKATKDTRTMHGEVSYHLM
jgi:hypothetical protein